MNTRQVTESYQALYDCYSFPSKPNSNNLKALVNHVYSIYKLQIIVTSLLNNSICLVFLRMSYTLEETTIEGHSQVL